MNIMSINKCTLCLCLLFVPCAYLCAESEPEYTCHVSNKNIFLKKGRISVSFTIDLGEHTVNKQHRRVITPIIRTTDNSKKMELNPVVITGRNRAIKDLRSANTDYRWKEAYTYMTGKESKHRYIDYQVEVEHHKWMDNAELVLYEEVEGCACGGLIDREQIVTDQLLYVPQLALSAERECPESYDMRTKSCDAFLIYPVDKTTLLPERYGNDKELAKIDSVLTAVVENPAYGIYHIDIAGFASPEGDMKHNPTFIHRKP